MLKKFIFANLLITTLFAQSILWKNDKNYLIAKMMKSGDSLLSNEKREIENGTFLTTKNEPVHFIELSGDSNIELYPNSSLKVYKNDSTIRYSLLEGKMLIDCKKCESELWLKNTIVKLREATLIASTLEIEELKKGEIQILDEKKGVFKNIQAGKDE